MGFVIYRLVTCQENCPLLQNPFSPILSVSPFVSPSSVLSVLSVNILYFFFSASFSFFSSSSSYLRMYLLFAYPYPQVPEQLHIRSVHGQSCLEAIKTEKLISLWSQEDDNPVYSEDTA